MRLESALYTSREGLNAHGQAIGVIGDNISNVNTVGYKTSRTEFADILAEGPDGRQSYAVEGGGNGVQVARIRQVHETGVIEFTGRTLDVAVAGEGYFILGDPANPNYTRAGNFEMNDQGFLVDPLGQQVLGTVGTDTGTLAPINLLGVDVSGTETTFAALTGNLSASEKVKQPIEDPLTFNQINEAANTTAAFTVNDSLGAEHSVFLAFFKTGTNTWTARAYVSGSEVGQETDSPVLLGESTFTFESNGVIAEGNIANTKMTVTPAYSNGSAAESFEIDLSGYTQYSTSSVLSGVAQDGQGTGEVNSYAFKKDGRLVAVLSSGEEVTIGTIHLADFRNLDGLVRAGSNLYKAGENIGEVRTGAAGGAGLGQLEGGSLERSTVDLANQFVELTIYQRGYQANSQILNAASTLIRDTLGLIR